MQTVNVAFVVENNLGHRTHLRYLRKTLDDDPSIEAHWLPIEPYEPDLWSRLPLVRNQTPLCWSGRTASKLKALQQAGQRFDLVYLHTINIALAAHWALSGTPTVLSLDTTPEPAQTFQAYRRGPQATGVKGQLREWLYRRTLAAAAGVIGLSPWVTESLQRHYGIDPGRLSVQRSGVDLEFWGEAAARHQPTPRPCIVFVGGDFQRKGGDALVRVWRESLQASCDLVIVSSTAPDALHGIDGLQLHRQATPAELVDLFAHATLLALPSHADAVPWVVMEAMAAGLPVVATRIGGLPWMVEHGVSGLLIPDGDDAALRQALASLVGDPARARAMGRAARSQAVQLFNARENYAALGRYLKSLTTRA